jgi:ribosome-associated protein
LTTSEQPNTLFLATLAAKLAEDKKARETKILGVADVSQLADFFVICTADSSSQIRAISDSIRVAFRNEGVKSCGEECDQSSRWHLLDYGDVVIHVLHPEERAYYRLEDFWSHAEEVPEAEWPELQAG